MNTHGKLLKAAVVAALFASVTASWAASPTFKPVTVSPATGTTFVRLGGNSPAMGTTPYLQAHNPSDVLTLTVALQLQNQSGLSTFLKAVQDPHSPQFRHFLTPNKIAELYSPSQAQVNTVTAYLTSMGVKVADVTPDRLLVHASAPTAVLERAFAVNIGDYNLNGATVYAPDSNPRIRSDVAPLLTAIMGLDNVVQLQEHLHVALTPAPASSTIAGGLGPSGYSPQQLATHYNWPLGSGTSPLQDTTLASGVTIAIATAYTYRASDVQTFWTTYGLPTSHTLTNVAVDGVTRRVNDETTLDVEHSGAMAPGAAIMVYSGVNPQFQTFVDVFDKIETDNLADVVSTSWGDCEPNNPPADMGAEDEVFLLMLAQGQSLFAAAGDGGAQDRCTKNGQVSVTGFGGVLTINPNDNADFPSSDPGVGAAGGTSLVLSGTPSESAWVDGGGADSVLFAEPSYETSVPGWSSNTSCFEDTNTDAFGIDASVACGASGNASRQSSDLTMDADFNLTLFYNGRWLGRFGGTSFVAPELTGLWAIGTKALRTATSSATARLGSAPGTIYGAVTAGCQEIYTDIGTGSNNGVFDTAVGWDHPTGWGVPIGSLVVGYLANGTCP